jgi:hypothetical protein
MEGVIFSLRDVTEVIKEMGSSPHPDKDFWRGRSQ